MKGKYKFDGVNEDVGMLCILLSDGSEDPPQYTFQVPDEQLNDWDTFGICELQEGIFTVSNKKTQEDARNFLVAHGYEEVK